MKGPVWYGACASRDSRDSRLLFNLLYRIYLINYGSPEGTSMSILNGSLFFENRSLFFGKSEFVF